MEDKNKDRTNMDNYVSIDEKCAKEGEFLKSIIDTVQVIILVLDVNGNIVSVNKYMEKISGYQFDEIKGRDWFSTFLPERNRAKTQEIFKKAVGNVQTDGNVDAIITKDGRELYIEWYDKTLKDKDGNVTGLVSIGHDVTNHKKLEEDLAKKNEELQKMNTFMMGRELKMVELKKKITELEAKI